MDKYSKIAFKLVSIMLKVKKGNTVSIAGEIHNLGNEPLVEIPLIEELAIAIRKREGFPVLDISTESLKSRYVKEIPEKDFDIDYYSKYVDLIDIFIDVGWRSNPDILHQLTDEEYQEILDRTNSIWQRIFENDKKVLFMGYPTRELANYYQLNLKMLQDAYFNGIDCDYNKLFSAINYEMEQLGYYDSFEVVTSVNKLVCRYKKENCVSFNGQFQDSAMMTLPTGRIEIKVDDISGSFFAEKVFYKTDVYENVEIHFEKGMIKDVDFSNIQSGNNKLESILKSKISNVIAFLGFNEELRGYINYLLFDKNNKDNFSLQLRTENQETVTLANMHNKIKYTKGD